MTIIKQNSQTMQNIHLASNLILEQTTLMFWVPVLPKKAVASLKLYRLHGTLAGNAKHRIPYYIDSQRTCSLDVSISHVLRAKVH